MDSKSWLVYLSGEIHSDWRTSIVRQSAQKNLALKFLVPELDHATSDDCGAEILGTEDNKFWYDHKAAKVNSIRTRKLIAMSDVVVVRFGEKYRQWNAAFDAGCAVTLGKSLITMHDPSLTHALKEIDAQSMAVTESVEQVVRVLAYVSKPGRINVEAGMA